MSSFASAIIEKSVSDRLLRKVQILTCSTGEVSHLASSRQKPNKSLAMHQSVAWKFRLGSKATERESPCNVRYYFRSEHLAAPH